jgi:GNAT superfamily N-acetyltransferase
MMQTLQRVRLRARRYVEPPLLPSFVQRGSMISIFQAATNTELNDVRALMRGFLAWHRERHVEDMALIDRYFDAEAWEAELAALPGKYAPPKGSLLVAYRGGQPAGCVALRDLGDHVAEMKRMFVPTAFRGLGVGRALADRVMADARKAGYRRMRLDTSRRQKEAIRLYEDSGFERIPPYYPLSDDLRDWLIFFERSL